MRDFGHGISTCIIEKEKLFNFSKQKSRIDFFDSNRVLKAAWLRFFILVKNRDRCMQH